LKVVEINKRYYTVPENWNELSKKQLLQVVRLLYLKNYAVEKALLKLLKILTAMSWYRFGRAPIESKSDRSGLEEYLYLPDFLIRENNLTRQLLPDYGEFHGPCDGMTNLRMNEFVFSEHYYMQWAEGRENEKLLNNLVAVLYRPKKRKYNLRKNKDGDARIAFNENLCEFYATSEIYAWPKHVKLAIVCFYEACRAKMVSDNPDVFGGEGEPAKHGLISIMLNVAETHVFGGFDQVEQLHVSLVLIQLSEMVHKAKELEKQYKK
jgi:hypothetical protein